MKRRRQNWQRSNETRLYKLLFDHLPNHRSRNRPGSLSTTKIASDLEMSTQAVWSWFEREKISLDALVKLCSLNGSTLTIDRAVSAMQIN